MTNEKNTAVARANRFRNDPASQPGCQSAGVIDDPLAIDAKATGLSTVMRDAGTMVIFAGTPYAHLHIGGSQRGEMNIVAVFGR